MKKSLLACTATVLPALMVPVTAVPARTAKFPAVPTEGAALIERADDATPLMRASSREVRDAADEGAHARRDAASGTKRASRALRGAIWVLQVRVDSISRLRLTRFPT